MIFGRAEFLLGFAATLALFFAGPRRWRRAVLVASGLLFYAWLAPASLPLAAALVVLAWRAEGRVGLWLLIAAAVGLIAVFKVPAAAVPASASEGAGRVTGLGPALMPLGLSFLAFELIHVAIERRKRAISRPPLLSLAAFALYAPCRIAGPIKRFAAFDASIDAARWSAARVYDGLVRAAVGFAKKLLVADVLALAVPQLTLATSTPSTWLALLSYSGYIYLDFSAYSDIAIGLSMMLGVSVPENFRRPYLSRNIREFWTRWHISFSSWLTDYVFLPASRWLAAGPLRLPPRAASLAGVLVTFLVCGVWHGVAWHFIAWGLYHGVLLCLFVLLFARRLAPSASGVVGWLSLQAARLITFFAVTVGWVLFAVDLPQAARVAGRLLGIG
jgi:alginate O-acetyltransferase complex protein AlgI